MCSKLASPAHSAKYSVQKIAYIFSFFSNTRTFFTWKSESSPSAVCYFNELICLANRLNTERDSERTRQILTMGSNIIRFFRTKFFHQCINSKHLRQLENILIKCIYDCMESMYINIIGLNFCRSVSRSHRTCFHQFR